VVNVEDCLTVALPQLLSSELDVKPFLTKKRRGGVNLQADS
jgi:hypothetical protein